MVELRWRKINVNHLGELPEGAIQTGESLCFIVLQYRQRKQQLGGQWVTSAWKDVTFDD
jgi:hypothetical protein|tara:strand:- start:160 stop:336 length:177 start_codon:yes stop_codon:yes gene_type:complete